MIAIIGFVLECVAAAALAAMTLSALALVAYRLARPVVMLCTASTRASVAFFFGTLPAIGASVIFVAVAAPSIGSATGLAEDHCPSHAHHLHVCFVHAAGLDPFLAAVGVAVLVLLAWRAVPFFTGLRQTASELATLEATGETRAGEFPLILVAGGPQLCHATGILRRRVVVSKSLWAALGVSERECALAHEQAHLCRHDPCARLLLALAGFCAPAFVARFFEREYQRGSEEACDATAAVSVGAGRLVAEALVSVVGLQRLAMTPPAKTSVAFGEADLERRVRRLLDGPLTVPGGVQALWVTGVVAAASLAVGLTTAPAVHHAVETIRSGFLSIP